MGELVTHRLMKYKLRTMATVFTQLDTCIAAHRAAISDTTKPAVCYLLGQVAGAARHLVARLLADNRPRYILREDPDQLGYWFEPADTCPPSYSLGEVEAALQQIWEQRLNSQPSQSPGDTPGG